MIETANEYLRLTNKHKPALLELAGSDVQTARDLHALFGIFGKAIGGDKSAAETLSDVFEKIAKQIPPNEPLFNCVADLFFAVPA